MARLMQVLMAVVFWTATGNNYHFLVSGKNCPLPTIDNGIVSTRGLLSNGNVKAGRVVRLTCVPGYILASGNGTAKCTSRGIFSASLGECKLDSSSKSPSEQTIVARHTCEVPTVPEHATLTVGESSWEIARKRSSSKRRFFTGSRIVFQCQLGYVMTGKSDNFCLDDGNWMNPFPKCTHQQSFPQTSTTTTTTTTTTTEAAADVMNRNMEPINELLLAKPGQHRKSEAANEPAMSLLEIVLTVIILIMVILMVTYYFAIYRNNNVLLCC